MFLATAVLPAVVRWGPPPLKAAQLGASNLGATKTNPGNCVAAAASAPSSSGGITMVSPAAGGVGQSMLPGPRITVIRSMRFKPGYLDFNVLIAPVTWTSHCGWVVQHMGTQLSTVRTT